jgi:hypothetical protein
MSTDAGNAAAPEDIATREAASARPGFESADPGSADSATSTPETADRGIAGSANLDDRRDAGGGADAGDAAAVPAADRGDADPSDGFVADMLRDATITGFPGETGEPPAEPHAPQAQQEGDEPVGSEPPVGDNPYGVD